RSILLLIICICGATPPTFFALSQGKNRSVYYPAPGNSWERQRPEDVGMDSALLEQAVAYAKTQASTTPADFSTQVETFGRVLGPLPKVRGDTNGIIIRSGYIAAAWGDTNRIAPTYSGAKRFLSALCGRAVGPRLLR